MRASRAGDKLVGLCLLQALHFTFATSSASLLEPTPIVHSAHTGDIEDLTTTATREASFNAPESVRITSSVFFDSESSPEPTPTPDDLSEVESYSSSIMDMTTVVVTTTTIAVHNTPPTADQKSVEDVFSSGVLLGISVGILVAIIVVCMSIIVIVDRVFQCALKVEHDTGETSAEVVCPPEHKGPIRPSNAQSYSNVIANPSCITDF